MKAIVYTDASYCEKTKIAACSFLILLEGKLIEHSVVMAENVANNSIAEEMAIRFGLEHSFLINKVSEIYLYTDSQNNIPQNILRADTIERKKDLLDTIEIIEEHGILLRIYKVKAHYGNHWNGLVDKSARKQLTLYLKGVAIT